MEVTSGMTGMSPLFRWIKHPRKPITRKFQILILEPFWIMSNRRFVKNLVCLQVLVRHFSWPIMNSWILISFISYWSYSIQNPFYFKLLILYSGKFWRVNFFNIYSLQRNVKVKKPNTVHFGQEIFQFYV